MAEVENLIEEVQRIDLKSLVNKPKVFDGKIPHPRIFLEGYMKAGEDNNWNEKTKIRYFKTFLSDDAEDWYDWKIRPIIGSIVRFSQLQALFTANYLGQADEDRTRAKLEDTKQKPEDLACNFIPRVLRMLLLLDPEMNEKELVARIKVKLLPHYQPWVAERQPETVDQLRDVCMKVEAGMNAMKTFGAFRNVTSSTFVAQSSSRGRHENNFPKKESSGKKPLFQKSKPFERKGNSLRKRNCYRCGRNNHLIKECRAKTKVDGSPIDNGSVNMVAEQQASKNEDVKIIRHCCNILFNITGILGLMRQAFTCNNQEVEAVVDTGASITVADYEFARKNSWEICPTKHTLTGAGGDPLNIMGSINLEIGLKIGKVSKTKIYEIPVVKDFVAPLLVGLDILKEFKVVIDPVENQLVFKDAKQKCEVSLTEDQLIPARSVCVLESRVNTEGTILVFPNVETSEDFKVANLVVDAKDNKINLVVMNPNNKEVEIKSKQAIAGYERFREDTPQEGQVNAILSVSKYKEGTVNVGNILEDNQIEQLRKLLNKYEGAFLLEGDKLGETSLLEHKIELLPDAKPVVEPLRRRPMVHVEETQKQVEKMLNDGIIEHCDSPWASAYVLVKKKNGSMRLCIDYRKLNNLTKKSVYPLPNIQDCIESICGKQYFSQIDFASGFWQIKMEEKSKDLTAFRTEDGLFRFTRMPFGLTNAPASFQKMMNILTVGLKGFALQAFIDDVCIATYTWEEHLELLGKFFKLVINANLKIQPAKCIFGTDKVIFLGHEISRTGIRQDPEKLRAIAQLPRPTTVSEVRRVIGMMSYYRKFVPNFAMIAEPIIRLTKKDEPFIWREEQEAAFRKLIESLLKDASLTYFNHDDPICVKTDASGKGVAAILLQKQDNEWKLVHCCSRRLSSSEQNYGITDLEGLAVVFALQKFRPYLLGKKFQIIVDHCALCALNKKLPTSPRLKRWAIILSEYDYEIVYTKGTLHQDIDCLSRAPVDNEEDPYLENKVYAIPTPLNPEEYKSAYNDEESRNIKQKAKDNVEDFYMVSDIIYFKDQLYVPKTQRENLIRKHHSNAMMGHGGAEVTEDKMSKFWWPTMSKDIEQFIEKCEACQINKINRELPAGTMNSFNDFEPFHRVAVDTFGPVNPTLRGHKYIIVIIDMFSRFIETEAIENVRAPSSFKILNHWFSRYGPPKYVLTDRGPQFLNDTVKELLETFGVEQQFSTPGHGRGNAIVERAIQTVQEKLSIVLADQKSMDNWDIILPNITFAINTSLNASTGFTPYELVFGRKAKLNIEIEERRVTPHDLFNQLVKKQLQENQALAIDNVLGSNNWSRRQFERRHRTQEFEVGEKVLVRPNNRRRSKLEPKFLGPFEVLKREKDIYQVKELSSGKTFERHTSALKRFIMPTIGIILSLICIMGGSNAHIFEPTMPIIWRPIEKIVLNSIIKIKIYYTYENPCDKLKPLGWQPSAPVTQCQKIYNEEFVTKIKQLEKLYKKAPISTSYSGPAENETVAHSLDKRSPYIIGAIAGTVGYYFVSNLVKTVRNYFTGEDENENIRIQNKILKENFDTLKAVSKQMLDKLEIHDQKILSLEKEWNEMSWELPNYVWTVMQVYNSISKAAEHLERIIFNIRANGKIELNSLSALLNITELCNCDQEDTTFESIQVRENTIILDFEAISKSVDTFAFEVDYFPHWVNLTTDPTQVTYDGAEYLIYNKTNNCMKSVIDVRSRVIPITCQTADHQDRRLDKWKTLQKVNSIEDIRTDPIVKITPKYYNIYCFNWNITVDKTTYVCPKTTFRVPNWREIQVGDFELKSEFKEYRFKTNEVIVDDVYYGQFTQDILAIEEMKSLKSTEQLRFRLEEIDTHFLKIEKKTAGLSISAILILVISVYLIYKFWSNISRTITILIAKGSSNATTQQSNLELVEMNPVESNPPEYAPVKPESKGLYPFVK